MKIKLLVLFIVLTVVGSLVATIIGYVKYCKKWGVDIERIHNSFLSRFNNSDRFWEKGAFRKENQLYKTKYKDLVTKGSSRMKDVTILIMGACKNLRPILPDQLNQYRKIGSKFKDYKILLYENDSSDGTTEYLKGWSLQDKDRHILFSEQNVKFPKYKSRLPKMQIIRQKCLDYYKQNIRSNYKPNYIILFDTDLIVGVHPDGLSCAFATDDWDIQWANGHSYERLHSPYSYVFSLKNISKVNYDGLAMELPDKDRVCNGFFIKEGGCKDQPYKDGLRIPVSDSTLIPMNSAFGGIGIYKEEAYSRGIYYDENNVVDDCEHILFHRSIRAAGFTKTYINPLLLLVR